MSHPHFLLLYVASPAESSAFYTRLLGKPPIEHSPTFAMFALDSGVMLGLWASAGVEPAATPAGGSELAFAVQDAAAVDARFEAWQALGMPILQTPSTMDFGYTFTATDPDGHRLRVFSPGARG